MKPALSVIFFTVMSGAGLGLLIWLALAVAAGAPLDAAAFVRALLIAAVLVSAGLVASTFHLASPRNAWHSFRRFGSSWLSREAVFAVLLYPAGLWFALEVWREGRWRSVSALLVVALALAVLVSTAMIYACLRTVPHWNNWQTRFGMPLYGLMSGGVLLLACWPLRLIERPITIVVLALLVAGLVVKYRYFLAYPRLSAAAPSVNEALNLGRDVTSGQINARVRLLDVGHSHGTFLTREFGYAAPTRLVRQMRWAALGLGFVLPFVLLLYWPRAAWLAVAGCLAGLLAERWLFFAEARHVVRRYHDLPME